MANELIIPTGYEIFRYDKNIVTNMSRLHELVDEGGDSGLLRSVMCFLSWEHQHNIFDEGIIDPEKFAKDYGYSTNYLRSKCKNPFHLTNASALEREEMIRREKQEEEKGTDGVLSLHIFDNIFENALYVLQNCPWNIVASGGFYKMIDGDLPIKGSVSIQIIKRLHCFKRGRKYMYYYELSEDFVKNLTGYFLNANRENILKLRSHQLDELYLNLCNLKANLISQNPPQYRTIPENTPSFDVCCRWANIPFKTKDGRDKLAKRLKSELNEAFKFVKENTDLNFVVEWHEHEFTGTAYVPCFVFSSYDAQPDVVRRHVKKEFQSMFREELKRHLGRRFREINEVRNEKEMSVENFYSWLRKKDLDREEKRNAFESAYYVAFRNIPTDIEKRYENFLSQIMNGLDIEAVVL